MSNLNRTFLSEIVNSAKLLEIGIGNSAKFVHHTIGERCWINFVDENPFTILVGSGGVELLLKTSCNKLELTNITINLWKPSDLRVTYKRDLKLGKIKVQMDNEIYGGQSIELVQRFLDRERCDYVVEDTQNRGDDISYEIFLPDRNLIMSFEKISGENGLAIISIGDK